MSVTFHGRRADGTPIALDIEDVAYLNMASANARAFLSFLGIEPGEEPSGEVDMAVARRAVMRARATFDRHVGKFTREMSDTQRRGHCRVIEFGLDADYFERRLNDFEVFLDAVIERSATAIYWG
jgi:hypothetical protein